MSCRSVRRRCWRNLICCAALACLVMTGCVHRQLVIRSEPPGAIVEINGERIGPTPLDYPFDYYGDYRIKLTKDGYQTLVINQPVCRPWYEYPPLDFISENLVPFLIRDIHRHTYPMVPLLQEPPEAVLHRSEDFRQRGRMIGCPPGGGPGQPPPIQPIPGQMIPVPPSGAVQPIPPSGAAQPVPAVPTGEQLPPPAAFPPPGGTQSGPPLISEPR